MVQLSTADLSYAVSKLDQIVLKASLRVPRFARSELPPTGSQNMKNIIDIFAKPNVDKRACPV